MEPSLENILDEVVHLLAEEMHLLGQEAEDSLSGHQSQRLNDLTAVLDQMHDRLQPRRHIHGHHHPPPSQTDTDK